MTVQQMADHAQGSISPAPPVRRSTDRIDPAFGNRFRLALFQLVLFTSAAWTLMSLALARVAQHPDVLQGGPGVPVALGAAGVAAGLLMLRLSDRISNRYRGPTFRMIRALEAVRRGERPKPVSVRKKDEFGDLVQSLNETLVHLGVMDDPGSQRPGG